MSANLFALIESRFPADGSVACLETTDGRVLTWDELDRRTAQIARLLLSFDPPAGARVLVQVDKSVTALLVYLATLRAGLVFVPLNPAYREAEVEYFVANAEPSIVVCAPSSAAQIARFQVPTVLTLDASGGSGTLVEQAATQPATCATVARAADDLACILYTSGTTGRSKGAMLSHRNLSSNALTLHTCWGWRGGDTLLHALPIFHVHGLFVAVHGALLAGAKMIWLPKFEAAEVLRQLPRSTVFMGVPTMYTRLLADAGFGREACTSMRLFISGSAPLAKETFDEFRSRSGHTILERYGMSETSMLCSNPYRAEEGPRLGGTVGRALPDVSLRLVDEAGEAGAEGGVGNVQVKGPNIFQGYWRAPEKTAEDFSADGWFKTGDVGRLGGEGIPADYLTIVGRSKDLIITGGYNVYPKEVESFIDELPGVAECAVFGVPDADFGEAVAAVVVPRPGSPLEEAQIIAALRERIARFKVPKRVHIVTELPRNAMGKVQKNILRSTYAAAP